MERVYRRLQKYLNIRESRYFELFWKLNTIIIITAITLRRPNYSEHAYRLYVTRRKLT